MIAPKPPANPMKILLFLTLLFSYQSTIAQTTENLELSLSDLEGKWYINLTNFPMWLKGNKVNPTFNYEIVEKKGTNYLYDQVMYEKNGKQKSIVGYDKPMNAENTEFRWRGKGLLKLLKSDWKVLKINKEEQWAIVYFEKTLFTPEGYEVISRAKNLSSETLAKVEAILEKMNPELDLTVLKQE